MSTMHEPIQQKVVDGVTVTLAHFPLSVWVDTDDPEEAQARLKASILRMFPSLELDDPDDQRHVQFMDRVEYWEQHGG